jgi:uncharacterized protein
MAEHLGVELGADLEIIRAAALLHDVADAAPGDEGLRDEHELASANFAANTLRDEGWDEAHIERVLHCIRSHRYRGRERPETLEAQILFDADKLDVMGAFGIARTIGYALQAGQPIYAVPSKAFRQNGELEVDEPHSAYHEYLQKLRHVADRLYTQPAKSIGAERHRLLESFFDQLVAEANWGEEAGN